MTREEARALEELWARIVVRDANESELDEWNARAASDEGLAKLLKQLRKDLPLFKRLPPGQEPFLSLDGKEEILPDLSHLPAAPRALSERLEALADRLGTPAHSSVHSEENDTRSSPVLVYLRGLWRALPRPALAGAMVLLLGVMILWPAPPDPIKGDPQAISAALARQPVLEVWSSEVGPGPLETLSNGEIGTVLASAPAYDLRLRPLASTLKSETWFAVLAIAEAISTTDSVRVDEVVPVILTREEDGLVSVSGIPSALWSQKGVRRLQMVLERQPPRLESLRHVSLNRHYGRPVLFPDRLVAGDNLEAGIWIEVR